MQVKAGAKEGEIAAQRATVARIKTETTSQIAAQNAVVARIDTERQNAIAAQQATITRLESELANAQIEYQRYQTLYQEGAISASIRDSKRLTLDRSEQQLKEAQANLDRISLGQAQQIKEAQANLARISAGGQEQIKEAEATLDRIAEVRPVDVQAAQAEVNQALAAVKRAQANLDQAYVKSPRDTQVLKIHNRPGEIIAPEGIAELGETSQMYAVAEIYESDIKEVKKGQNVQITSDSFPGELKGIVERIGLQVKKQNVINTDPSANIDNRVVEVRIRLDPTSSQKVTGLTNLQVKVAINI
jgi:HlyD family secretion protein